MIIAPVCFIFSRENTDENNCVSKTVKDIDGIAMDCDVAQKFFLQWYKNKIWFGAGWTYPGGERLLQFKLDSEPVIKYAGVASTYSNADWRFCKGELICCHSGDKLILF